MKNVLPLFAALTLCVGLILPAQADQTITVTAVGEVKVKPDVIVLTGEISESSEKMKDAVTAFNDTRRRAMASIKETGIANLSVSASALSVSLSGGPQMDPFGGEQAVGAPAGALVISQSVSLTVSGVDKMDEQAVIDLTVQLIKTAKDAGVEMSANSMQNIMMMQMGMGDAGGSSAVYKISDPDAAYKAATKAAVEKARADAAYLAELAGGKLGPVVRISDAISGGGDDGSGMNPYMLMFGEMMGEETEAYTTTTLDEISVARPLTISFQLITE